MTTTQSPRSENPPVWTVWDTWLLLCNIALVAFAFAIFNHRLPDVVASHFDRHGEQNGTMSKRAFWILYAALTVALPAVLTFVRQLDPRKNQYEKFRSFFLLIRWALSLFLHGVYWMTILYTLGYSFSVTNVILGAFGLLWVLLGNRLAQVKSNFFIGIRTPWTLSDDDNWTQTHRMAAKLWFVAGLLMFALAWFVPSSWAIFVLLAGALGSSLVPVVYSYLLFNRKKRSG